MTNSLPAEPNSLESVSIGGVSLRVGDRVRLRPQSCGDILDLALAGKSAMIEAIEQDYEDRLHIAVLLDDDPGSELGELRQPGHRFFFAPDEIEPWSRDKSHEGGS